MSTNNNQVENRLWGAADELRANSKLKASEYSIPVLGLIFLRYADVKFVEAEKQIGEQGTGRRRSAETTKERYQAMGVLYLPGAARFNNLLKLPEGENIGQAINDAMRAIEAENPDLKDVLPKTYNRLENTTLVELLKLMGSIPMDIEGDAFGRIYEYFLGKFAMTEGQKGGEFFTPTSIVRLIVEIIEPFHGRIFDPACGSGGMFVQSARFVGEHKANAVSEISVYGQERVAETVRLGKMNLAVHGLSGDIRQGNTYYEDLHNSPGMLAERFPDGEYQGVAGLCKVATIKEIEAQGWSLNPGRYVGVAAREEDDFDFFERLEELNEELEMLNNEARELEERIAENVVTLIEGVA